MALVCMITLTMYKISMSHTILRHPIQHQLVPVRLPTAVDTDVTPGNLAIVQTSQRTMDAAEDITSAQVPRGSMPNVIHYHVSLSLPSHHPYLIALYYNEQLASATRNFFQLVNLTVHWNKRAVEPFIAGSKYSAVPSSPSLSGLFRFSDFCNISSVAAQMRDCFSKDLVLHSFEDFLVNATREFLLLNFWMSDDQSGQVADCTSGRDQFRKAESRLNKHLERVKSQAIAVHGEDYKFKGVRAVCAEASNLSVHEVAKEVLSESNKHLSVVVSRWRSIQNVSAGGFHYYNPGYSWLSLEKCRIFSFARTQMILDAADEFTNSLSLPQPLIGVHLRTERLALDDRKQPGHFNTCLNRLHAVAQALLKTFNYTVNNIVAIHDYSKYGSNTCAIGSQRKCNEFRDTAVEKLKSWGIKVVSYDPASFKRPLHSGFVSVIEKEFLSGTNHLITVGGGTYQRSVESLFITKHQDACEPVYRICQHFTPDILNGLKI